MPKDDWDNLTNDDKWGEEPRVRVGEPASPVMAGDINPTNGVPYVNGQFAPSIDSLTDDTLRSAADAGVLPSNLPIYDERGDIDKKKLDAWDPDKDLAVDGYDVYNVPKHTSAIILASLRNMGKLPGNSGLRSMRGADRDAIRPGGFGDTIIAAKYSSAGRRFRGELEVYPDFFKFIYTPILPKIPGRTSGVSVATYAVFHAMGHLLFAKLAADGGVSEIGSVLGEGVWSKTGGGAWGSYFGNRTTLTWKRSPWQQTTTQLSKNSPSDDFAETFALFFNNPDYLRTRFPEKFAAIKNVVGTHVL